LYDTAVNMTTTAHKPAASKAVLARLADFKSRVPHHHPQRRGIS
jgi:hypothetical protein